jgi:Zn-dependent peptidase ImmA (M78 family)
VRENIANWESELWNYLRIGDGDRCPLYNCCDIKNNGHWCIIDHEEFIGDMSYLINSHEIDPHRGEILRMIKHCRIFKLVELLANKHLDLANITSSPVPESLIELIRQPNNIEVRLIPLTSYHGALWYLDDSWVIQLNSNDDYAVRRLTIFHEAFHVLAHSNSTPVFRKIHNKKGAFNELLAEYFTYNILMPEKWVREKWAEVQDIDIMAEIFEVPKSAMVTMLSSLQLIDIPESSILINSNNQKAIRAS